MSLLFETNDFKRIFLILSSPWQTDAIGLGERSDLKAGAIDKAGFVQVSLTSEASVTLIELALKFLEAVETIR